jgi:predicted glycoside hydrolase/deacetylase ChbG (UPF0249 family)
VVDLQAIMRSAGQHPEAGTNLGPPGTIEVFCHPGTQAADVEKPGSCDRFEELNFLLSPRFRDLMNSNGARTVSYWDV